MKGNNTTMEYAVISLKNKQLMIKPGSKISMLGQLGNEGDIISDAKVLLFKDKEVEVGTPYLDKKIDLKIVTLDKTDKITIFKYKSKSRYRRKTGHRQGQTILEVVSVKTAEVKSPKVDKVTKTETSKTKTVKEK
jgi:large subunit ribosomal protein L21